MFRYLNTIFVLLCISTAWRAINCDGLQTSSFSENDDDYISPKDIVLENSYHGLIRENETLVEITPLIKVDEEKICNFRILKKPYHEIPFQIDLVNNLGILKARHFLNCEKRKSYHFEIVAVFCDGTHSAPANVHIAVIDINEYVPTFLQPSYVTEVEEGRLYKEIIRVEATDKDCTPLFGDICKYEILNNDQPFIIDNDGSIKNTEPLSHKAAHNHILSVVAYDCAMQVSAPIMVSIKVRRVCEAKFLGIPERIDYTTSSGESLLLFPNARLELCDLCPEQNLNIRTSVALRTKYISFGCDRDMKNCPKTSKMVDLLPQNADWTKAIRSDEGFEALFHFDGLSGVVVPNKVIPQHDFSVRSFSIMTMFRHLSLPTSNKHIKEHIICSADDHKMNRHHMALFVRNCRLIFLLRKNFNEGDLNIFSPAEWRWKVPQVCDNDWHHYVLNVDKSGKIELFIDGVRFENSHEDQHSNPEVIDDWPLHAAHGVNTTLSIGACYQSSENRLKHGFNGDISEIKMLLDRVFSSEDVKCGTRCAEYLIAPPESLLEYDSQLQTNAQSNEIFIEGQSKSNIEKLLQKIQYVNTKENPTVGRRNIEVRTTTMCVNQSTIRLPSIETYVMVNEPSPLRVLTNKNKSNDLKNILNNAILTTEAGPINRNELEVNENKAIKTTEETGKYNIKITGSSNKLVTYPEIKSGVHILSDVNITIMKAGNIPLNSQKVDSCSVVVFPSLNPDHEEIQVDGDDTLSATLEIKININKDGVEMVGHDNINNYLNVLKALVYSNKKPAYYLNRVFKLICSQQSAQLKTTEFTLTLTVLHPKQSIPKTTFAPVQAIANNYQINGGDYSSSGSQNSENRVFAHAMVHNHEVQEPKSRLHSIAHKAESTHPIMLIILVSVFLIILLVGVSVARIKNNVKYNDPTTPKIADESLVWDDTALTITINPMQTDSISDDSSGSDNSDTEDEEVTKGRYANVSQLEWDNSNIFTSHVN